MKKGDYTVHWSGKVCRVEEIAALDFTGKKREYFILSPVRDKAEKIYVPVEKSEGVLRPVLTREAAEELIGKLKDIEPLHIKDEKQRAQEYKEAFYSQNYVNLVRIAKELYQRREARMRAGKTLPSRDMQMMNLVEKTFEEEMSIALGVPSGQVKDLISGNGQTSAEDILEGSTAKA